MDSSRDIGGAIDVMPTAIEQKERAFIDRKRGFSCGLIVNDCTVRTKASYRGKARATVVCLCSAERFEFICERKLCYWLSMRGCCKPVKKFNYGNCIAYVSSADAILLNWIFYRL